MKLKDIDVMEGIDFKANKERYNKQIKKATRKENVKLALQVVLVIVFMIVFGYILTLIENMPL